MIIDVISVAYLRFSYILLSLFFYSFFLPFSFETTVPGVAQRQRPRISHALRRAAAAEEAGGRVSCPLSCLSVSLSLSVYLSAFLSFSVCLSDSVSVCLYLSLPLSYGNTNNDFFLCYLKKSSFCTLIICVICTSVTITIAIATSRATS